MSEMLERTMERYGMKLMKEVSVKYGINEEELLRHVKIEVKKVESVERKRSNIPLPFKGTMCTSECHGIRLNYGLYTQCTNKEVKNVNGYNLCKTCLNQSEKNSNGKPTYGYIQERIEMGSEYRDPKGKAPIGYGNVMEKLNLKREEVIKEAERVGIRLTEEDLIVKKGQRGRPKKDTATVDTTSEEGDVKPKRGRPKKEKKKVEEEKGEELMKSIVDSQEEKKDKEIESLFENESNEDSDDEEELAVTEFKHEGKKYLKAADNTLYDISSHEEIGRWEPNTKRVILE